MFEEDDSDRQVRYVNAYDPSPLPAKSGERESDRFCGTVALQLIGTCSACGTQKHSDYVLRERGLRDLNHADALHRRMGAAVATML